MNANFPGSYAPGGKSRLGVDTVRAAASGRWPSILADLGIAAAVLGKRGNQPCPACGGRDRFQFIDKDAGRFVCRALDRQGGDGFALVEHWLDCGFADALRAVAGVLGLAYWGWRATQSCRTPRCRTARLSTRHPAPAPTVPTV
ncbi:primase-helicase-like zinc-binding protein [Microvirgula sp. AG722]|uniref:primase-helicase zinc-binding domain-containing protein n=1 Tax=Microvirgula sp. AG722 TaxID=2183901 RepID=UPI000DC541DC|nr:primase-helicase zinc-binding domain-containing protein [Microvirgula sp. AG722]RAS17574.1 primase-helicase-like zinc-binding protein [Microvirgula sp. AG722]